MKSDTPNSNEAAAKEELYASLSPIIDFSFYRENDLIVNLSDITIIMQSSSPPFQAM